MNIFLIVCGLFLPVLMIVVGLIWKKHPPKKINVFYGYRTQLSMRNQQTWEFAHRTCGDIWVWAGLGTFVVSITLLFAFQPLIDLAIVLIWLLLFQLVVIIITIIPVEIALKKNFDKSGNPKNS